MKNLCEIINQMAPVSIAPGAKIFEEKIMGNKLPNSDHQQMREQLVCTRFQKRAH